MKMLLSELVKSPQSVVVAKPEDKAKDVIAGMGIFNSVPVVDEKGVYLGLFNKVVTYEKFLSDGNQETLLVKDVIVKNDVIVGTESFEDLVDKIAHSRYKFFAYVEPKTNRFLGIITNKQILLLVENILAYRKKGVEIEIIAYDRVGALYDITKTLRNMKINVLSLTTIDLEVMDYHEIVLKLDIPEDKENINKIKKKLVKESGTIRIKD